MADLAKHLLPGLVIDLVTMLQIKSTPGKEEEAIEECQTSQHRREYCYILPYLLQR